MEQLPTFSREFIKKKIAGGNIEIENRQGSLKPSTRLSEGQRVSIYTYKSNLEDEYWRGDKLEFDPVRVLYKDEDLFVISKPSFMSTHPAGKHLFHCANVYLEREFGGVANSVHRLDRETSGILLFGRSKDITTKLTEAFEFKTVKKCYFFIAHKKNNIEKSFTANESLESEKNRLFVQAFPENSNKGKIAKTHFEILFDNENFIMALAFPITGRQHQIRVHAAYHGMPLLGDKIYHGGRDVFGRFKDGVATEADFNQMQIPRHALHAIAISFPYKEKRKLFIDDIPDDLFKWAKDHLKTFNEIEIKDLIEKRIENYFKDFK